MPFDGTDYREPAPGQPRFFPGRIPDRLHLWLKARFCWTSERDKPWAPNRRNATVRVLEDAGRMIRDPKNWRQGPRRWFGRRRSASDALRTAASYVEDITAGWSAHAALAEIAVARGFTGIPAMNDRLSHAELLQAFDEVVVLTRRPG